MKKELCDAFCSDLHVRDVPAGLAVGTGFEGATGDPIGFYLIGPDEAGSWRIQDDGATVPYLEAAGADLDIATRRAAFDGLLAEYGAAYDEEACEIFRAGVERDTLPRAAVGFVALLLRVQDLLWTTREQAGRTWVDEARRELIEAVAGRATIEENAAIAPRVGEYPADLVLRAPDRKPVAVFFATSDAKIYEALLLHWHANHQWNEPCVVVAMLERDNALTRKARQRADNNIVVPRYRGGQKEAIGREVEEAIG